MRLGQPKTAGVTIKPACFLVSSPESSTLPSSVLLPTQHPSVKHSHAAALMPSTGHARASCPPSYKRKGKHGLARWGEDSRQGAKQVAKAPHRLPLHQTLSSATTLRGESGALVFPFMRRQGQVSQLPVGHSHHHPQPLAASTHFGSRLTTVESRVLPFSASGNRGRDRQRFLEGAAWPRTEGALDEGIFCSFFCWILAIQVPWLLFLASMEGSKVQWLSGINTSHPPKVWLRGSNCKTRGSTLPPEGQEK